MKACAYVLVVLVQTVQVGCMARTDTTLRQAEPGTSDHGITLLTDSSRYHAPSRIELSLYNGSSEVIGYNLCLSVLERLEAESWTASGIVRGYDCDAVMLGLSPGQDTTFVMEYGKALPRGSYRFCNTYRLLGGRVTGRTEVEPERMVCTPRFEVTPLR